MDERDAIQRCLTGDTDGFADIVRLYQGQILALCVRMTGSREDAADVAQQAFVNCYRHLDRYDRCLPFRPEATMIGEHLTDCPLCSNKLAAIAADDARLCEMLGSQGAACSPRSGPPWFLAADSGSGAGI